MSKPKIPYERIAPEANKLFQKMTEAKNMDEADRLYDLYVALLESAGYSPTSFDQEQLKRVDQDWDDPKETVKTPNIWN
jgi:hypothetical protein